MVGVADRHGEGVAGVFGFWCGVECEQRPHHRLHLEFLRPSKSHDAHFDLKRRVLAQLQTGFRNFALAYYMRSFGNIRHAVDDTLSVYFHQCALAMSCRQLAMAGRFLANDGRNPTTGQNVVTAQRARRINALMMSCGHYDNSGEFAFRTGLPGKSGVGGGILAVAPGIASIAVWSPGLNEKGNSQLGSLALERLTQATGWSVFEPRADNYT